MNDADHPDVRGVYHLAPFDWERPTNELVYVLPRRRPRYVWMAIGGVIAWPIGVAIGAIAGRLF